MYKRVILCINAVLSLQVLGMEIEQIDYCPLLDNQICQGDIKKAEVVSSNGSKGVDDKYVASLLVFFSDSVKVELYTILQKRAAELMNQEKHLMQISNKKILKINNALNTVKVNKKNSNNRSPKFKQSQTGVCVEGNFADGFIKPTHPYRNSKKIQNASKNKHKAPKDKKS